MPTAPDALILFGLKPDSASIWAARIAGDMFQRCADTKIWLWYCVGTFVPPNALPDGVVTAPSHPRESLSPFPSSYLATLSRQLGFRSHQCAHVAAAFPRTRGYQPAAILRRRS